MFVRLAAATLCLMAFSAKEVSATDEPKRSTSSEILYNDQLGELSKIDPAALRTLQLLDISEGRGETVVDDQALEQLERFQGLEALLLSCPKLTDKGLKHIAKLKRLECLIIYGGDISDVGIEELKVLTKLKVVGLHKTPITEEGIAKLKPTLKDTHFELSTFGKHGSVFDANGCMRTKIAKRYFSIPRIRTSDRVRTTWAGEVATFRRSLFTRQGSRYGLCSR